MKLVKIFIHCIGRQSSTASNVGHKLCSAQDLNRVLGLSYGVFTPFQHLFMANAIQDFF